MFGDAQSTYGEHDTTPFIAQTVNYVLDWNEFAFYKVMKAPASIVFIHTETCVDLTVGPLNVPTALQKTAKITNFSITSNVVTLNAVNSFSPGDIAAISGLGTGTYLNGQNLTVTSASATQFTVAFTHANVGSTGDSGTATQVQTNLYLKNISRATAATASLGNWY